MVEITHFRISTNLGDAQAHAIARLGGYLDRKSDGLPGWQTLWKGWMRVMDVLEGVHLAALLYPS
ncbi:IS4 family transposase [Ktedonobacter racemifer]|uniref:IS4 family transposase n=1 Tax=Ktedonobacter racemifer TaxID=363277 RepID=UPI0009FCEA33